MSLKAFHIVFITAAVLLAFAIGIGALQDYAQHHESNRLWIGFGFLAGGVALVMYERSVLRKLHGIDWI
jgi:hypothetical protein